MSTSLALAVTGPAPAQSIPVTPGSLILFGANWCAPCLAELRDLPGLARAVAPARLILAWTDGTPPHLWREWPDNADLVQVADVGQSIRKLSGSSAGLPYAILLDGKGKLCADLRGKVTPERIEVMKARCKAAD